MISRRKNVLFEIDIGNFFSVVTPKEISTFFNSHTSFRTSVPFWKKKYQELCMTFREVRGGFI